MSRITNQNTDIYIYIYIYILKNWFKVKFYIVNYSVNSTCPNQSIYSTPIRARIDTHTNTHTYIYIYIMTKIMRRIFSIVVTFTLLRKCKIHICKQERRNENLTLENDFVKPSVGRTLLFSHFNTISWGSCIEPWKLRATWSYVHAYSPQDKW